MNMMILYINKILITYAQKKKKKKKSKGMNKDIYKSCVFGLLTFGYILIEPYTSF